MIFKYLRRLVSLFSLVAVAWLCLTTGCARMGSPTGGPKDTLPPVLVKSVPEQGALNFDKNRITITFNEYVQLKETDKQFLMSPPPQKRPTLNIRNKNVVVNFNSPLRDSTTYQLDFGNSIVDNNEGNPFPNYRFSFSTGSWLDTMSLEGLILDAYTDQPVSKDIFVYLYENMDDSVVLKQNPDNLAKPNEEGAFLATSLKSAPYKLVVLADANKNYQYDKGQEAIGFLDFPVVPVPPHRHEHSDADTAMHEEHNHHDHEDDSTRLVVRMFTEDFATQYITSSERIQQRAFRLTFNAPMPVIDSMAIDSVDIASLVLEYSNRHDTITYWLADTAAYVPDTINLRFVYLKTDTLGQLSPFSEKRKLIFTEKKTEEQEKTSEKSGGIGGLFNRLVGKEEVVDTTPQKPANWTLMPQLNTANTGPIEHASLAFSTLPIALDASLITIEELRINPRTKDSSYVNVNFSLERDSIRLLRYKIVADWKENTSYRYMMLPYAFWDVYAQTNDTIQGGFATINPDKLSSLMVDFSGVDGHYVVQLMDSKGEKVVRQQQLHDNGRMNFLYLNPGSYRIRVIKDDNNNGKWDTGDYFKHIQPEYATFFKDAEGKLEFSLRQGWDVDLSVDLSNLFFKK